ncbi:heat shock protein beta-9 [Cebus imitator]|uniref:heat shock protein beta-9 n=1 Tax=Cebus imitator TaxID=2715852 RepID=UPI000809FBF1|nr:heat shock protein beta-9 [Cebus imitator]
MVTKATEVEGGKTAPFQLASRSVCCWLRRGPATSDLAWLWIQFLHSPRPTDEVGKGGERVRVWDESSCLALTVLLLVLCARSLELLDSSWLLNRIQRVGNTFSESRVPSQCPSVALAERNQAATLPVRLLKDSPAAQEDNDHARDSFQMKMDAHDFAPEELVVQVDGQWLMVTGQRQMEGSDPERGSYSMSQKMHRKTRLPTNMNPTAMTCCLTPSGQLWVRGQCGALALPEAQTGPSLKLSSLGSKASKLTQ